MYFEDLSANNLVGLASSLAIAISNDLDSEQSGLLAAFLTTVADNLAIIAIQKAKEKLGDQFAYFCSATCEYERQKYYVVDVKTKVEDHYSKVTQILVKSDGTDAKEGLYSEGREPEFFE